MSITLSGSGTISGLTATGISAQPVFPGNVLQVVQGTTSTTVTVATTTYTDTNLTATITPTSTSSKILVLVNQQGLLSRNASAQGAGIQIVRDSTVIFSPVTDPTGPFDNYMNSGSGTLSTVYFRYQISYLDSPSSTSAVTYKTQGRPYSTANSGTATFQQSGSTANGTSTIILMEIAG